MVYIVLLLSIVPSDQESNERSLVDFSFIAPFDLAPAPDSFWFYLWFSCEVILCLKVILFDFLW
jgi:hypothetical protein